ncbi:MAG TPA: ribonuclease III [Firmicutes bacterium]|nr:ribonuclease III [Bacillota bacterium]
MEPDLGELEKALGVSFKAKDLLLRAITHSSYEGPAGSCDNERLEFLGDAVLKLALCDYVFESYPEADEGELSSLVAFGASEATLSRVASRMGLGSFLRIGKGLELAGGRQQPSILADLFEAILGAVYLDRGFDVASLFVRRELAPELPSPTRVKPWKTNKTKLQEILQRERRRVPTYECISQHGPDHAKVFKVRAMLGEVILGEGTGKSKKEAEENAAGEAIARLWEIGIFR